MTTVIQFSSIILILILALPGTQILWSKANFTFSHRNSLLVFIDKQKSQISNVLLPGLKRIAAMFF